MLRFANVDYATFKIECELLRQMHFLEVTAPRGANYGLADHFYESFGENLRIITAYDDEEMPVGYHVAIVMDDIHDDSVMLAMTDMYFLHPDFRKGRNGIELLKVAEVDLTAFAPGVVWRLTVPIDVDRDLGVVIERTLHAKPIERLYQKTLAKE